jgi:hypothetical protein
MGLADGLPRWDDARGRLGDRVHGRRGRRRMTYLAFGMGMVVGAGLMVCLVVLLAWLADEEDRK